MNEFQLIEKFFKRHYLNKRGVIVGNGDDGAVLSISSQKDLIVATDTLVSGVHFLSTWPAKSIAQKALMANISDIAAMGGVASFASLALTLPEIDESWLGSFSEHFHYLLKQFDIALIGGDITKGPLTITITMHGLVERGQALKRSSASPEDGIYVSGTLGLTGYAVSLLENKQSKDWSASIFNKLLYPKARQWLMRTIHSHVNAAIDISDGLCADLTHILESSQVGALIDSGLIPIASPLLKRLDKEKALAFALDSGDEYELCFTVAKEKLQAFNALIAKENLDCTYIGKIEKGCGLHLKKLDNQIELIKPNGYKHF